MQKNAWKAIAGVGVLVVICAYWWRGTRQTVHEKVWGPIKQVAADGAAVFASLKMSPIPEASALAVRFADATHEASSKLDDEERSGLYTAWASFFTTYFADSPDEFIAWRKSQSYVLATRETMIKDLSAAEYFTYYHGSPPPDTMPADELYRKLWEGYSHVSQGRNRVVAIAAEARGITLTTSFVEHANASRGTLGGEIPESFWLGKVSMCAQPYWQPPRAMTTMRDHGGVLTATSGVICEFGDKTRSPMLIEWFWDPGSKTWLMKSLAITNTVPAGISLPHI